MSEFVPEGWKVDFLENLTESITVGHVGNTSKYYRSEGVLFLRTGNLNSGKVDLDDVKYITNDFHELLKKSRLREGDVLVSRVGYTGNAAIVPPGFPESNCANIIIIRSDNTVYPKYLHLFINSPIAAQQNSAFSVGSAQAVLNIGSIKKLRAVIPTYSEQQKIAAILSSVDEVIEKTQAQIDKLKDLKAGMMQELLTKGVGHTEFKDSPVGRIPVGWEVKRLKQMTVQIRDGNYGADYPKASEMIESGVPFLTSTVVGSDQKIDRLKLKYISEEKHVQLAKAHIKTNDVLFTNRGANVGNVAIVPEILDDANIGPQLTFLRVDESVTTTLYLYIALQTNYFKEQLRQLDSGSAMNFFGIGTTENFIFAVPSIEEQSKISDAVYSVIVKIDRLKEKVKHTKSVKKALMQDLLTGKVRVKV